LFPVGPVWTASPSFSNSGKELNPLKKYLVIAGEVRELLIRWPFAGDRLRVERLHWNADQSYGQKILKLRLTALKTRWVWVGHRQSSRCKDRNLLGDQAFQVNPQWPQVVGLRPASSESSPTGKKQMLTTIAHVG
jgi:hypothetical protein